MKNLKNMVVTKVYFENAVFRLKEAVKFNIEQQFPKTEVVKSSNPMYPLFIAADSADYYLEEAIKNLEKAKKHIDFITENENLLEG